MKVQVAVMGNRIIVGASKEALLRMIKVSKKRMLTAIEKTGSNPTVVLGKGNTGFIDETSLLWHVYEDVEVVPMRERGFKKGNKLGRKFVKGFLGYKNKQ